jgi:hypothetical protein
MNEVRYEYKSIRKEAENQFRVAIGTVLVLVHGTIVLSLILAFGIHIQSPIVTGVGLGLLLIHLLFFGAGSKAMFDIVGVSHLPAYAMDSYKTVHRAHFFGMK